MPCRATQWHRVSALHASCRVHVACMLRHANKGHDRLLQLQQLKPGPWPQSHSNNHSSEGCPEDRCNQLHKAARLRPADRRPVDSSTQRGGLKMPLHVLPVCPCLCEMQGRPPGVGMSAWQQVRTRVRSDPGEIESLE